MNEQEAIEYLEDWYLKVPDDKEVHCGVKNHNEVMDTAIAALKEVQEYHDTGHTPKMVRELRRGYLDAHKKAVQYATKLDEYHDIGGFEVCKAAVEKQTEKPVRDQQGTTYIWAAGYCPVCGTGITSRWNYCQNCGQKVRWEK